MGIKRRDAGMLQNTLGQQGHGQEAVFNSLRSAFRFFWHHRSWRCFKSKPIFPALSTPIFSLKIITNFQRPWDWRDSLLPALFSHLSGCSGSFPWDARAGPMATLRDSTELVPWQYVNTAATSSSEVLCEQKEARAHLNHQDLWKLITASRSQISLFLTIRSKPWRLLPSLIQTLHLCNLRESSGPSSS